MTRRFAETAATRKRESAATATKVKSRELSLQAKNR
jgi:hypothetical protein